MGSKPQSDASSRPKLSNTMHCVGNSVHSSLSKYYTAQLHRNDVILGGKDDLF